MGTDLSTDKFVLDGSGTPGRIETSVACGSEPSAAVNSDVDVNSDVGVNFDVFLIFKFHFGNNMP